MILLSKGRKSKRDALLEELAKEDLQVLALAYVYAKNLHMYGVDVTEAIITATENTAILDSAYHKGYHDGINRMSENENKEKEVKYCKEYYDSIFMQEIYNGFIDGLEAGKEVNDAGDKEQAKQMIESFTQFMRTLWNNPNLTVPDDMAEKFGIADKFREKKIKNGSSS